MIDINDIEIVVAGKEHLKYIDEIIETMSDAAKVRGTGIAKRTHAYLEKVMLENKAVLALYHGRFAGFSYIESWSHKLFVTNSGLIVHPDFRGIGVASRIKRRVFALARERYPMAKVFSLTTGAAVLNMNTKLGFKPVTFEVLTRDKEFWKGCESCVNYDILQRNGGAKCLCTALLYDPAEHIGEPPVDYKAASSSTQPKRREKVVLAYSGGLDTSFAVKYLSEDCGYDVYTATANTGGFSAQELATIEKHALELGAVKHVNLDITQEYYNKSIKYMVYGNVLRNGTYPISVSSERMFQAIAIIKYAKKIGADCVAHGSTGAGKTTITNLLNRFYDINDGVITIDGRPITDYTLDSLRANVAMVLQDTHLFTGTVMENIRYGRPDATDDEVVAAAKTAFAHSFIMRLEKGYDTLLEGDGANLSQGQRQLLNIARAALSKAPILVLDEATSSVDTRTERHIEQGMDALMQNRTTFVIAHRLSTVRNADVIMVLENGVIIERGNHEKLIAEKGRYYQLYTGAFELT